jgi:hypothetical protein
MKIEVRKIEQPFNERYVDVSATGVVKVFQKSGLQLKAENNNSKIGIKDNNFCLELPMTDNRVTRITKNPQRPEEIIFTAYNLDENGELIAERDYAIVDIEKEMPTNIPDSLHGIIIE